MTTGAGTAGVARPVFEWLAMVNDCIGGQVGGHSGQPSRWTGRGGQARTGSLRSALGPVSGRREGLRASRPRESRGQGDGVQWPRIRGLQDSSAPEKAGTGILVKALEVGKKGGWLRHRALGVVDRPGGRARGFVCLWATGAKGGGGGCSSQLTGNRAPAVPPTWHFQ